MFMEHVMLRVTMEHHMVKKMEPYIYIYICMYMYQWRVVYTYHMEPYIYIGIMENNSIYIYICERHIYEESYIYICLFVL